MVGVRSPSVLKYRAEPAIRCSGRAGCPSADTSACTCMSIATRSSTFMRGGTRGGGMPTDWARAASSRPDLGDLVRAPAAVPVRPRSPPAGCDHSDSRSPPMPIACPVTPSDSAEARNTTSPAASSGAPNPSPARSQPGSGVPSSRQAVTCGPNAGIVAVIAVAATGIDRVDRDAGPGALHRPGSHHADDRRLGRRVVGLTDVAALPGRRSDRDDPPAAALFAHAAHRGPHAGEGAAQVHVDDRVELLVGHLPQHAVAQDAGVGDEHVEPPVRRSTARSTSRSAASVGPTAPGSATAVPPVAAIFSAASWAASASASLTTTDAPAAASASA